MAPECINTMGLVLDIVGVALVYRFGLPSDVEHPDSGIGVSWDTPLVGHAPGHATRRALKPRPSHGAATAGPPPRRARAPSPAAGARRERTGVVRPRTSSRLRSLSELVRASDSESA